MFDPRPFMTIAPLFVTSMIAPGPCFLLVSRIALAQGRTSSLKCGAGISLAEMLWAALSLWGMGLLLHEMPWIGFVVRLLGGSYLTYLGLKILWTALRPKLESQGEEEPAPNLITSPFRTGILANLTNPGAMAFFSSIFTLILTPQMTLETKATTVFLCGFVVFLWFVFVSLALAAPMMRTRYLAWRRPIDGFAGSLLAYYGVTLFLTFQG